MRKLVAGLACLVCISLLAGWCNREEHSWSSVLRPAEITELGIDLSGITLSEDGAEFFNKITDGLKSDTEDTEQLILRCRKRSCLPLMVDTLWLRAIG